MRKNLLVFLVLLFQNVSAQNNIYRESPAISNKLVHTKLAVSFDYENAKMYGNAWLTLQPYFYATDSLQLDAKQMKIDKVQLVLANHESPLSFTYDGSRLSIKLNRLYKATEKFSIHIVYTAIPDGKGLYFINRDQKIKDKPVQVWTDGETEFSSYWCPTIDRPNQKGTLEIQMTVPGKYGTLSNGVLISQKNNPGNTRTDTWQMTQPLSPYLFFMCVGNFAVVKDRYKNIPVNYYVEKKYEPVAKKIFGSTPEMMRLFENITGIAYPWPKYAQVVLRDFTSTAMENTSITAHGEAAQQDARELVDANRWENNIAHELFHQWFGDYVTCESWSNLALNESFASYGTYLWREYKYGPDKADEGNYEDMQAYLGRKREHTRDLVRFYYDDQEDMFDNVSYQKGGCILHMLRSYVGDSAFFKSLHLYLSRHAFKTAEVHDLRLAFEEITGEDLNWFFNQWFYGSGHPVVNISYAYDETTKKASVILEQKQAKSIFRFPLDIDVYDGDHRKTYKVWASGARDTFSFSCEEKPVLINVDVEKYMLWEKTDNKSLEEYSQQYYMGGKYMDRLEAVKVCLENLQQPPAVALLTSSLTDKYAGIRLFVLQRLAAVWDKVPATAKDKWESTLAALAANDSSALVRAKALEVMGTYHQSKYAKMFSKATGDSSYSVAGAALIALSMLDSAQALSIAKSQARSIIKRSLLTAVLTVWTKYGPAADFDTIYTLYAAMPLTGYKISVTVPFIDYLGHIQDIPKFQHAIDQVVLLRDGLPPAYRKPINESLANLSARKLEQNEKVLSDYILAKKITP